jgi:hypothetical protein
MSVTLEAVLLLVQLRPFQLCLSSVGPAFWSRRGLSVSCQYCVLFLTVHAIFPITAEGSRSVTALFVQCSLRRTSSHISRLSEFRLYKGDLTPQIFRSLLWITPNSSILRLLVRNPFRSACLSARRTPYKGQPLQSRFLEADLVLLSLILRLLVRNLPNPSLSNIT